MRGVVLVCLGLSLVACDEGGVGDLDAAPADAAPAADAAECEATPTTPCDCAPATPGNGGRITPSRPLQELVADPLRCRAYGRSDDGALVVFDTRAKRELFAVPIPTGARDLDVAVDGSAIGVALGSGGLAIIDPRMPTVVRMIATLADVERVEVDRGRAFYVTLDQWNELHRVELVSGADTLLGRNLCYECGIVLAEDGRSLVAATSRASPPSVERFGVAEDAFGVLDSAVSLNVKSSPDRSAALSTDERRLYFARAILDATDLDRVLGTTAERILLEDSARRLAIGTGHFYDVPTGQVVGEHPQPLTSATLASSGAELWSIESSGEVGYVAMDELRAQ